MAASILLFLTGETKGNPHVKNFWRPALSCTLASPFGCKFRLTHVEVTYQGFRYVRYV